MADYYPLIARALEGLPDPSAEARGSVYERARTALTSQLRSVQPALAETEILREIGSLDEAIARAERTYGGIHEAEHASEAPPPMPPPPREDAFQPRMERTPAIRRGGKRGRALLTAMIILAVVVPLAALAWLWRDRPASGPVRQAQAPTATPPATPPANPADPKDPERVGGGSSPAAPPSSPPPRASAPPAANPAPPPSGQTPPAANPAQPPAAPAAPPATGGAEVPVAHRAALVEENTGDPQQSPKITPGRVLWRLEAANAGQGQPLETVVRASVDVPEAGMTLQLTMRRNRDQALPASHTIELVFTTPRTGERARLVRDVNPPNMRSDDGARGMELAGLSVPVKENLFLIGLSDLRGDVERNLELLQKRNWMEMPLRFDNGQRANLIFEKGPSGERVVNDAFRQWAQP